MADKTVLHSEVSFLPPPCRRMALNRLGLLRPALSQAFATRLRPVLGAGAGSCIPHALQNGSLEKPKGYPSPQVRFYATKKSKGEYSTSCLLYILENKKN